MLLSNININFTRIFIIFKKIVTLIIVKNKKKRREFIIPVFVVVSGTDLGVVVKSLEMVSVLLGFLA